jgi:uncharacterized protein (DUF433 family)
MDCRNVITIEPGTRSRRPCIMGLRVTVPDNLECLASGLSSEETMGDCPELTEVGIRACLCRQPGASPHGRTAVMPPFDPPRSRRLPVAGSARSPMLGTSRDQPGTSQRRSRLALRGPARAVGIPCSATGEPARGGGCGPLELRLLSSVPATPPVGLSKPHRNRVTAARPGSGRLVTNALRPSPRVHPVVQLLPHRVSHATRPTTKQQVNP